VAHLTIRIVDANQQIVPTADNDVTVEITGPARIIGIDNGDPTDHDSFKSNRHKTFNGMCLAIVQSNQQPGPIHLTARSPGLRPAAIDFSSLPAAPVPSIP
jgi:beta-galactosidase